MARTTLDIATPVLEDLKKLQETEGKPLGQLVSELVAQALADRARRKPRPAPFRWNVSNGRLKVDLEDKEAVAALTDAKARDAAKR